MEVKNDITMSLPKGYKQTSIGIIPEDWTVTKLKNICKITSGLTPLRSNNLFHNGDINWVKTTDLNNGEIHQTEEKITNLALEKTSIRIYPINTVLVAMYGGFNQIGRTGLLKIESTINQALSALNYDASKIDGNYLQSFLNANVLRWRKFAGSSRKDPNITSSDVGDFVFAYPPLPEQQKIAEILSTWDKAVETCQKTIAHLKERNKGLAQQLLSGKKFLAEGEDAHKDYHVIGKYVREVSKRNSDLQEKRILSVTNSRGFINQSEQFGRELASADLSNYKIVKKGQFAYNPSRVNVGSLDLLRNFDLGVLSPMYVVFEVSSKDLLPEFLFYHLKTNWFIGHIPMFVQGSVRDTLSFDGFSGMKFFIPSIEKQKEIIKILDTASAELKLYEEKLQTLQQQKKGLMQQLLTGKVRTIKN